jgi:hypothetical protein
MQVIGWKKDRHQTIGPAVVCAVVGLGAGLASAIGVFMRGDETWETVTSVRGETYEMATTGVYAWNAQRVVAEGVGWDLFTLVIAAPALLLCVPWVARGSFRARVIAAGVLGYFLYQYLEYAVTWAFGPLFLLFVVLHGASLLSLVWLAAAVARDGVQGRFGDAFPRRGFAALSLAMAAGLSLLWIQRIVLGLTNGVDGLLLGETTMTVQALDLGLVVPISVLAAALAWRRGPIGLTFAAGYAVTFAAMAAAITAMLLSAWVVEGSLELPPVLMFGLATIAMAALAVRMMRSVSGPAQVRVPPDSASGRQWKPGSEVA